MRILVSNDDGVYSPGLAMLAEVAREFGEVRVVAPDVERSSAGQSITASRPLSYRSTTVAGQAAFRVNGTPADCVALGMHHWDRLDVVLSGVNIGLNLGHALWHSGTLAAAKQATLLGSRGIAISAPAGMEPGVRHYVPWVRQVLQALLVDLPPVRLVNVNLPRHPRGLIWTRASMEAYDGCIVPARDPQGREIFWFTVTPLKAAEQGSDRWAVEQQWISMTPLSLDATDDRTLVRLKSDHPLDAARAAELSPTVSSDAQAASVRSDEAATAPGAAVAAPQVPPQE